jgi:hypothetical protein
MVGEDLNPGANDEDQQEQIEEMLNAQPRRETRRGFGVRRVDCAGIPRDEVLHRRLVPKPLRNSDRDDQQHEADRREPEQVEPSATDAHARRDSVHARDRASPRRRVDHVLAGRELPAVAADEVGETPDCAGGGTSSGVGAVVFPTIRSLRRRKAPSAATAVRRGKIGNLGILMW